MQVPVECPQAIADLIEHCLSMEPQLRPSARDVFDVITKVQLDQEQQAAQDSWDASEGPPRVASQSPQTPASVSQASSLQQFDHSIGQTASRLQLQSSAPVQQAAAEDMATFGWVQTGATSSVGTQHGLSS